MKGHIWKVLFQCGNELLSEKQIKDTCDYIVDKNLIKLYDKGVLVVNNIKMFENTSHDCMRNYKNRVCYLLCIMKPPERMIKNIL